MTILMSTASFMTEATTYLQQCSTSLSLSLRYLALSPQLLVDYLTCHVRQLGSLNKRISQRVVLISKVAPIQKNLAKTYLLALATLGD